MRTQNGLPRSLAGTMLLALAMGCGEGIVEPPPPGTEPPGEEVTSFFGTLPTWSEYAADVNGPDAAAAPTGPAVELPDTTVTLTEYDDEGGVTVTPEVTYRCTETPYSVTQNPQPEIAMYNPDVDVLWPGGLIQGRSRKELGSLLGLTINERAPIQVSIPAFAMANNFIEVANPSQGTVASAIGEIVGNATASGIVAPSTIVSEIESYHSESHFALNASLSGRYLGFSGSVSGSFSRDASKSTVAGHFYHRMFEVVVAPPSTPSAFFSSDFTAAKLQEQVTLGRMGPTNVPIYVSEVVYGRMMMFTVTSSASVTDIRAAIQASYDAVAGGVDFELDSKHRRIMEEAEIRVTSIGGHAQATLDMLRTGNWSTYFTEEAPLSSAAPLSYTFKNLGDGSVAGITETTEYNIRTCEAIPATPGTFAFLDPQVETAPFSGGVTPLMGDINGDGREDMIWNQLLSGTNQLFVGISAGDGTFEFTTPFVHPVSAPEGWGNYTVHVANVNGDEYVDLVWNYLGDDNKTYFGLGAGDGTFATPSARVHTAHGWDNYTLLVGDQRGPTSTADGLDDMVWVRYGGQPLGVYSGMSLGNSQLDYGSFSALSSTGTWAGYRLFGLNLDGDGDMDFALNSSNGVRTYKWTSDGDDSWTAHSYDDGPATAAYAVRVGDVTGTGSEALIWADTASTFNGVTVGMWNGSGFTYTSVENALIRETDPTSPPLRVDVGDVDGDGDADLVWSHIEGPSNVTYVSLGEGDGTFDFSPAAQPHSDDSAQWAQYKVFIGDVNGDGRDDIVWNHAAATNRIYTAIGKS